MTDTDHVVLLDDDGREIGTAPKSSVHGTETALHLAFSCHVVNDDGQVQTAVRADPVPDGASGWHTIGFSAD